MATDRDNIFDGWLGNGPDNDSAGAVATQLIAGSDEPGSIEREGAGVLPDSLIYVKARLRAARLKHTGTPPGPISPHTDEPQAIFPGSGPGLAGSARVGIKANPRRSSKAATR